MLDAILGYYIQTELKGFFETVVYEISVPAGSESAGATKTTKFLTDSEDGAAQKAELDTNSFIIYSGWTLCETGHVQMNIFPDADTKLKFRIDATQKDRVFPVLPPMVAQVDLQVDFINSEFQINNTHLVLNVIRIPDENLPAFHELARLFPRNMEDIDLQTLKTHNDLVAVISLLSQLLTAQGKTPQLPTGYTPELSFPPSRVCLKPKSGYGGPRCPAKPKKPGSKG